MISSGKIILAFLLASPATAQHWVGVRAGTIHQAEGIFYIDRDALQCPEACLREIPQGKSLRTGTGWVEVQLGPNAYLWMGENSALRIEDPSLTNIQLLVEQGSVLFEVSELAPKNNISIRFGEALVRPRKAGIYRLDGGKSLLSVYAGKAEMHRAGNKTTVKQGYAAPLSGDMKTSRFDVRQTDRLHEIAAGRSQILGRAILEASAQAAWRPMAEQRWYEARQEQQQKDELDRIQREMEHTRAVSWEEQQGSRPTEQEGHQVPPTAAQQDIIRGSINETQGKIDAQRQQQ
jgi:hypothetical protein